MQLAGNPWINRRYNLFNIKAAVHFNNKMII